MFQPTCASSRFLNASNLQESRPQLFLFSGDPVVRFFALTSLQAAQMRSSTWWVIWAARRTSRCRRASSICCSKQEQTTAKPTFSCAEPPTDGSHHCRHHLRSLRSGHVASRKASRQHAAHHGSVTVAAPSAPLPSLEGSRQLQSPLRHSRSPRPVSCTSAAQPHSYGGTALHVACEKGYGMAVHVLVEHAKKHFGTADLHVRWLCLPLPHGSVRTPQALMPLVQARIRQKTLLSEQRESPL